MIFVVFESADRPPLEARVPTAARLLDVCDEQVAPLPFSCRSASCGTCRVEVLEGADLLDPPTSDELEVLGTFGDDPSQRRLACQVRLRAASGRLRLRRAP